MGRVTDFEDDSVSCDSTGCDHSVRVPIGVVEPGWLAGTTEDSPQSYDACSNACAMQINLQLAQKATERCAMGWYTAAGKLVQTSVLPPERKKP